jgi:hypothetical protein
MRDVYLSNDRWVALLASLTALDPNQLPAGRIDASDYVTALGEAGIWPMSVLDDPGNPNHDEREALRRGSVQACTCNGSGEWQTVQALDAQITDPDDDDF